MTTSWNAETRQFEPHPHQETPHMKTWREKNPYQVELSRRAYEAGMLVQHGGQSDWGKSYHWMMVWSPATEVSRLVSTTESFELDTLEKLAKRLLDALWT
jgi:hypothetical protein